VPLAVATSRIRFAWPLLAGIAFIFCGRPFITALQVHFSYSNRHSNRPCLDGVRDVLPIGPLWDAHTFVPSHHLLRMRIGLLYLTRLLNQSAYSSAETIVARDFIRSVTAAQLRCVTLVALK
jgi:hypothetical protein